MHPDIRSDNPIEQVEEWNEMSMADLQITYVGGPTALLEFGGVRLLTDPTFDPPGSYPTGPVTLTKVQGPAVPAERLGQINVVLLSHDHHSDNLDHSGKALLRGVSKVLTTVAGAERLGPPVIGLEPWQSIDIPAPGNRVLRVTGTPARHGPAHMDRGPVIGFVLAFTEAPDDAIYVSGDTVWYEGVAEVSRRFRVRTAILFMGAARVPEVGPWPLTMTAEDAIAAAKSFPDATIVPLHFEGWTHFSESRDQIAEGFRKAGLEKRLWWVDPIKG